MRKEYIAIWVLILLVIGSLAGFKFCQTHPVIETSKNFIMAAAEGKDTIIYSTMQKKNVTPGIVDSIDCHVIAYGNKWAKTRIRVELTLADKTVDVNWYELELAKNNGWKVISINKTSPAVDGYSSRLSKDSQNDIENVFNSYLDALQAADYKEAKKCLAGPAREKFEQYISEVGPNPLFKSYADLHMVLLWTDNKFAMSRLNYLLDGSKTEVLVGFYKTKQGWKIVTTK